jgi:hypothetical protein
MPIVNSIKTLSVIPKRPSAVPDFFGIGSEHASFTSGCHYLVMGEGKSGRIREGTRRAIFVERTAGLSAILNNL